jgi:hypothetical protein
MEVRAAGRRVGSGVRVLVAAALAVAVASVTAAGFHESGQRRLETPHLGDLLYATGSVSDEGARPVSDRSDIVLAQQRRYRTAAGEILLVVSPLYAFDEAQIRHWLEFIGSLLHGDELDDVLFYVAPPSEIAEFCGPTAAACYLPGTWPTMIVTPGEDLDEGLTAEAILAHEYGHHIANSRPNPPWGALFYGTKRWASYVDVCAAVLAGQFFPGDGADHYSLNPGEGFAEAYRVTNQRRLGAPEAPWRLVDRRFYPDATASGLVEQDVVDPWTAHRTDTFSGRFTRTGPTRHTFEVSTGLDGVATASVRAPKGAKFRVTEAMATVCGQRTTYFTVRRVKGFGKFVLTVSRP